MLKSTPFRHILIIVTGLAATMMSISSIQAATAATTSILTAPSTIAPVSTKIAKKKKGSAMKKGDAMKKGNATNRSCL